MKGVPLFVLLAGVVVGIVAYHAGRAHNPPTQAPSPVAARTAPVLRSLGTPKDLCCCRMLGDGQTNLSEALENYAKAKSSGDHKWACLFAGCVVDEYTRLVNPPHPSHADLDYLEHWREIEKAECTAGGFVPRQR